MKSMLTVLVCLTLNAGEITVAWDPSPNDPVNGGAQMDPTIYGVPAGYNVYWGVESGLWPNSQNAGLTLTNTISGLTNGLTYWITVKAYNSVGESPPAEEISHQLMVEPVVPGTPSQIRVIRASTTVTLEWEPAIVEGLASILNPSHMSMIGEDRTIELLKSQPR